MLPTNEEIKDQLAEARRNQILMGAAQVFSEKGFHKATTKEIARAAGVSEGTIYNYFDNKRELLIAMIEVIGLQSLRPIMDAPPENPRQLLETIMHDRLQLARERGHLMLPIFAELFIDPELRELVYDRLVLPFTSHIEKHIQRQIDAGRLQPIDPIIFTRAAVGAVLINFLLKLSSLDPRYEDIPTDSLVDQLTTLLLEGILKDE